MPSLNYQQEICRSADRLMLCVIAFLCLICLGLALWFDTWTAVIATCVPTLALCTYLVLRHPAQLPTRLMTASALMVLAALMIHETQGLVEIHFGIFALLAFLLYYRDWRPIVMAAALIAVHHVSFFLLEQNGVPVKIFQPGSGFGIVLLHAGYVVFEAAVLVFMAVKLKQESAATGDSAAALSFVANEIARGNLDVALPNSEPLPGTIAHAILSMKNSLRSTLNDTEEVLGAMSKGDFSSRVATVGREGVGLRLAELVNSTSAVLAETMAGVAMVSHAIAAGDLSQRVVVNAGGITGQLSQNINQLAEFLTQFLDEQKRVLARASSGDFGCEMETEHRLGYQLELARGLNTLIQTSGHSLTEVHRVVGAIARGDLTQRIDADFHGTFGAIKEASNATAERLADVVGRISSASFAISAAAEEIARGNANLSLRTEAQAAGLQTTASSMEELTATVKQNAQSAKQASQLALSASDVATDGGRVVEEVIRTMASISDASTRIADIISVIDGIAFQTNILALNAAVEAARAGEQGRGFAVVATEVRSLAQRSAAAAREIKDLIGNSTDKVEAGSKLVSTAGQTMIEVVSSVKRVSDIINEITAASEEQSAGIEQVNQAIAQMDQTTQQNAVLVEDAGAAARAMASQAQDLDAAVSVFERVGTQDPPKLHKGVRLAA